MSTVVNFESAQSVLHDETMKHLGKASDIVAQGAHARYVGGFKGKKWLKSPGSLVSLKPPCRR